MFLFLKKIGWWFHYCKWIFDIEHLVSLVEVLECIAPKIGGHHSITSFLQKARAVIQHGEHVSKHILQELESLLQDISNHQTIREFLRNESVIGGGSGVGEAWTSAKMHAFLECVASWNNGKIFRFQFRESNSLIGITSGDMHLHGHNVGAIHRAQIHQIWVNNGAPVTSPTAPNDARRAALTPRRERRTTYLASSSSSVQTLRQTPRPLNVLATPVETSRTNVSKSVQISYLVRSPIMTPRFDQKDFSWLLEKLWSDKFLTYLRDCYNLSKIQGKGSLWVFYDLLNWYKSQKRYENTIFFNQVLQKTFFQSMCSTKLVLDALSIFLSDSPTDNSLWILRHEHLSKQEDFFEVLRMVIRHELWLIQTQSLSEPGMFIYKCSKGAWVQHPETLDFVLYPPNVLATRGIEIVEVA
jgi:hypothetical protein